MATLSLTRAADAPESPLIACHWSATGGSDPADPMGSGGLGIGGNLVFALTQGPVGNAICAEKVDLPTGPALLRLDEVAFPEGAIAYRHIHPGPGIRTLVQGGLRLISDHETFNVTPGEAWFEGAQSPVRAENTQAGVSRFVRAMILPVDLQGKPSIKILAEEDLKLPRLQVTHRHLDHLFTL